MTNEERERKKKTITFVLNEGFPFLFLPGGNGNAGGNESGNAIEEGMQMGIYFSVILMLIMQSLDNLFVLYPPPRAIVPVIYHFNIKPRHRRPITATSILMLKKNIGRMKGSDGWTATSNKTCCNVK